MKKAKKLVKKAVKKVKKPVKKSIKKTVKKAAKKPVKKVAKKVVKKAAKKVEKKEELIGKITHYYDHIEVGIIEVTKNSIEEGEKIHIKGTTTDFEQEAKSMQVEHEQVSRAKKGDVIGLKVKDKVREGDLVYKA
jgi:putative protease